MYVLNKIVGWTISPAGIALALVVASALAMAFRRAKIARILTIGAFGWLWLWSTPVVSRWVGATLESAYLVKGRVPRVETFPTADAIVLLGGSMGIDTALSDYAEMWTSADRVWQASRLYKAARAPKIIITSPGCELSTKGLLMDFGVPTNAIAVLREPRNTEQEAKCVAKCFIANQEPATNSSQSKVLLVTSAWHMKRAMLMFEKYASAVEVIPAPADFENSMMKSRPFSILELFPDHNAFLLNSVSFHEWLGYWGYKLLR